MAKINMFKKAKNKQGKVKINIYGEAGSGKSFTSLLIAEGLATADGKKIAVIDSEDGYDFYSESIQSRRVHKDAFDFDIITTKSIFEATDAAKEAINSEEYSVVIVDSVTNYYEAAKKAWTGKMTSIGTYPIHAWQKIYEYYDALINPLLAANKHVIFCGRLGNVYSDDKETRVIGKRMKAKSEQAYETQMLFRITNKNGDVKLYVEKDRSSILDGKTISMPTFENTIALVAPLLCSNHESAKQADDGTKSIELKMFSSKSLKDGISLISRCKTLSELEAIASKLGEKKKNMDSEDINEMTIEYMNKKNGFDSKADSILDKIK